MPIYDYDPSNSRPMGSYQEAMGQPTPLAYDPSTLAAAGGGYRMAAPTVAGEDFGAQPMQQQRAGFVPPVYVRMKMKYGKAFNSMPEYTQALTLAIMEDMRDRGIDMGSQEGMQYFMSTLGEGSSQAAAAHFVEKVQPKELMQLKDGSVFDPNSKQIIHDPAEIIRKRMEQQSQQSAAPSPAEQVYGAQYGPMAGGYETGEMNPVQTISRRSTPTPEDQIDNLQKQMNMAINMGDTVEAGRLSNIIKDIHSIKQSKAKQELAEYKAHRSSDPESIEFKVDQFLSGGPEPTFARGEAGAEERKAFDEMKARVAKERGISAGQLSSNKAMWKADQAALSQIGKQAAAVEAFNEFADANMSFLEQAAEKLAQFKSPIINKWANNFRRGIWGDPEVAAYNALAETTAAEFARITTGASGGNVLSDSARQEFLSILSKYDNAEQVKAIGKNFKREAQNRIKGYETVMEKINKRMALRGQGAKVSDEPISEEGGGAAGGGGGQIFNSQQEAMASGLPKGTTIQFYRGKGKDRKLIKAVL